MDAGRTGASVDVRYAAKRQVVIGKFMCMSTTLGWLLILLCATGRAQETLPRAAAEKLLRERAAAGVEAATGEMEAIKAEYAEQSNRLERAIARAKRESASLDRDRREKGQREEREYERQLEGIRQRAKLRYESARNSRSAFLGTARRLEKGVSVEELETMLAESTGSLQWEDGAIGALNRVKIVQRIGEMSFLGSVPRGRYDTRMFLAQGWSVQGVADDDRICLGLCRVTGTTTYTTVLGGTNTVYVVKPIRVAAAPISFD